MQAEAQTSEILSAAPRRDLASIEAAVQLLNRDTRHREMRCLERRSDTKPPFQRPVEVVPISEDGTCLDQARAEAITAYTGSISFGSIVLLHNQAIDGNHVLLNFELLGGETISLVAHLTWCRYLGDFWYSSGGRFTGLLQPMSEGTPDGCEYNKL